MPYVTPAQLADGPGAARELSELFDLAAPELLIATVDGGDRSAWSVGEIEAADAALASIGRFILQADGEVNSRLAARGYTLPQDATQFPVLTTWARAIARYHLQRQRDKTSEESGRIERDYRDALRALDLVAAGKLTLGAGDPLATHAQGEGAIRVESQPRVFSRTTLGRL